MLGLPRHLDDVAAQRARAVSNWAAQAVAALRERASWAISVLADFGRGAARRVAPTAKTVRARALWLKSRLVPALIAITLGAGACTAVAPVALIVVAGSVLLFPPADGVKTISRDTALIPEYATFVERFRTLNDTRWQFSDGWDNGAYVLNDWRRSTLHPGPNGLEIVMGPNPPDARMPFASGELQSHESYRYGYFEVRMRVPRGNGTGVGFFTYTEPGGRSTWQEIDIEFVGRDTRAVELTYHLNGRHSLKRLNLPFDAADGFHTYAFEWTPQGLRWYVDNQLAREAIGEGAETMNRPQRLYLSLWTTTLHHWAGQLDRSRAPWTLSVTCVAQAREYRGESLCAP